MSAMYAVDAIQFSMVQSLKQTIRKIQREKHRGLEEIVRSHYLNGTFAKLCRKEHFQELVFPGFSREALRSLPLTLVDLFAWEELQLDVDSIAESGATVLRNIKLKGAKQGQIMDEETEKVLLPQIAQEALAKRILEEVQKLNRKISCLIARSIQKVAASDDERAERDQLESAVVTTLQQTGFAVQEEFLGLDWLPVLRQDITRFIRDEKLSLLDALGQPVASSKVEDLDSHQKYQQIAWVEKDESLQETYPALYELLDALYALAFELNAKAAMRNEHVELLEPSKGCTLFTLHPVSSAQTMRLDTRVNVDGFDSGIRMTCCYHLQLPMDLSTSTSSGVTASSSSSSSSSSSVGARMIFAPILRGPDTESPSASTDSTIKQTQEEEPAAQIHEEPTQIPLVDDLLTLHKATAVRNARTADDAYVWVSFHHFICGRSVQPTAFKAASTK